MDKLIETFCDVDEFCLLFIELWQQQLIERGELKRRRACKLSPSERITIFIVSINPITEISRVTTCFMYAAIFQSFLGMTVSVVVPMWIYLTSKLGRPRGIQFVDSTKI